jgi:hypothetical protein
MFVEPGPMDAVHAKVLSRLRMRAYAADAWTIACSLRAWWYGSPAGSDSSASSSA